MKKILSLFASSTLIASSVMAVVSCGSKDSIKDEEELTEWQINELKTKYINLVRSSVRKYFSYQQNKFLFSKETAQNENYSFFNLDNLEKLSPPLENGEPSLVTIVDENQLNNLKNDVTSMLLNLDDMKRTVEEEISQDPDRKLIEQFKPKSGNYLDSMEIKSGVTLKTQISSGENPKENYTVSFTVKVNFKYNFNNNDETSNMELISNVNILERGEVVQGINTAIAQIPDKLFNHEESKMHLTAKDIGNEGRPFDPTIDMVNDYFGLSKNNSVENSETKINTKETNPTEEIENENKLWIERAIQEIFNSLVQDGGIIVDSSKMLMSDLDLKGQLYNSTAWTSPDIPVNGISGDYLLRRKDHDEWETKNRVLVINDLQKIYGSLINNNKKSFKNNWKNFFESNNVAAKDEDFVDKYIYGSVVLEGIRFGFDGLEIVLNPTSLLFNYGSPSSLENTDVFITQIVDSWNFAFESFGFEEVEDKVKYPKALWQVSSENTQFWEFMDNIMEVLTEKAKGRSYLRLFFWELLTPELKYSNGDKQSDNKVFQNIIASPNFKFNEVEINSYALGAGNNFGIDKQNGHGVWFKGKEDNNNSVSQFKLYVRNFTLKFVDRSRQYDTNTNAIFIVKKDDSQSKY